MITPAQEKAIFSILRQKIGQTITCTRCNNNIAALHACRMKTSIQSWKDEVTVVLRCPENEHRLKTVTLRLREVDFIADLEGKR